MTPARPGRLVLTRWVPGCCSSDEPVDVEVLADEPAALPGTCWEVEGTWVPGTGAVHGAVPEVEASALRAVSEPPPAREG